MLDVWPALPLLVRGHIHQTATLDNIIAALEHRNRVSEISLCNLSSSQLTKVLASMKEPFPELINLRLQALDSIAPLDLDLSMGNSTPCLRHLELKHIPYPGLPNLLLSSTHIVSLCLYDIPHSGYISPEAMVTCLSVLTSLETLCLELPSFQSHLDWESQRLPLPTRSVLPSLMYFDFRGARQYLEDLTSRIDAPRLNCMTVDFIIYEPDFDNPQLAQFISCTPEFRAPDEAHVIFDYNGGWVTLLSKTSGPVLNVKTCRDLECQLSALAQVCNLSLPPLSTVEDLYICVDAGSELDDLIESDEWLELLKPFTSVKNLYLSDGIKQRISPALRLLVEDRTTEVLPTLESIFVERPLPSGPYNEEIRRFISPAHPPNVDPHRAQLDHEQDSSAPPPTAQLDRQTFSLGGSPQTSGREDVRQFISAQQPDPHDLQRDFIQPSGPSEEHPERDSSAQSPTRYNLHSEESQTSRSFQQGGRSDPQSVQLDWLQPSERFHVDPEQRSSAQPPTLQNLYSVEPQLSRPLQEGNWPGLQNLRLDWSLPSEPFQEDSAQLSSAQSPTMQSLYSVESQPSIPFQERDWPGLQNLLLDWPLPSEPFREDSARHFFAQSPVESRLPRPFRDGDWPGLRNLQLDWSLLSEHVHGASERLSSALSPTLQSIYSVEPQPSIPFQEGDWPGLQSLQFDRSLPSRPFLEDSEQLSSALSPSLQSLYSVESQPSIPFQEGDGPGLQNPQLDWPLPSESFHEDFRYSSAQSPTLQSLYSVESQPSIPPQEVDLPGQNLQLDPSLPSELFYEDSQHSSAQAPTTVQNLDSEDSQLQRPLQEGHLPDPQNLDESPPSEDLQWEECIGQFVAARQRTTRPITIFFWDRKCERAEV